MRSQVGVGRAVNRSHGEPFDLLDGTHHLLEFSIVQRLDESRGVESREFVNRGCVGNGIVARITGRRVLLHRGDDAEPAVGGGTQHVVQGDPSGVVIGEDRQATLVYVYGVLVREFTGEQIPRIIVPPRPGSPLQGCSRHRRRMDPERFLQVILALKFPFL